MINLYSDTQTQPSAEMRKAMANAEVGDEQRGLDPTVNQLCERIAELSGKAAAMFLPSGTMCNEIALMVHCQRGDEIICHESAHIINYEAGAPSYLSGAMLRGLPGAYGQFDIDSLKAAIRFKDRYAPRSRVVCLEQTSNGGGGTVWPLKTIRSIADVAKQHDMKLHMDGARLFNASVAANVSVADFCQPFDSIWVDLSKGLGCPVGAVLAGSEEFIQQAWRYKQGLGGAMRQAGIIAAAGLYALDHNIERLAEDHQNARYFAEKINQLKNIEVDLQGVQSNLVYFNVKQINAHTVVAKLKEKHIDIGADSDSLLRAVTHMDVSRKDIDTAIQAINEIMPN